MAAAIVPTCAFAATTSSNSESIIHFLNPTSIAIVGNDLFVADNIEDNHSAILCFDVSSNTPVYKYTHEVDGSVINLSAKGSDGLFAIVSDKIVEKDTIVEFAVNTSGEISQKSTYEVANAVDVTTGLLGSNQDTVYILSADNLLRIMPNGSISTITSDKLSNTKGCVTLNDSNGKPSYICYLSGNDFKIFDGANYDNYNLDILNKPTGFNAVGLFVWNDNELGVFTKNSVSYIDRSANASLVTLMEYSDEIRDAASQNDKLFVLSGKNKVEIYTQTNNAFDLTATIGSETVERTVPTKYTSFTLAHSNGYPTNIVYKTTADTSVTDIITDASEYIILGFDGDADCNYYYVLIDNNFGWVKKSDNAETVENDAKIEVIDTQVSNNSIEYKTKLNSLNAVYIYELPRESFDHVVIQQTATTMMEVTVLQKFTETKDDGDKVWYYVSYGDGEYGFVNAESVGHFYLSANLDEIQVVGAKKVNSSLFAAVKVYATSDLDDDNLAYTSEGNQIKLYSGERVVLVSEGEGWALIQVEYSDGTTAFGYVTANRLIDVHSITTNAIVGLSLLGAAIVIAVIMLVIFSNRKKGQNIRKEKEKK